LAGVQEGAAETIRDWTAAWNGLDDPAAPLPAWTPPTLDATRAAARAWRDQLTGSTDLVTRLLAFVREKR
jgi:hypothetical protein